MRIVLFIISTLLFMSCKKEGCTDINSDNYEAGANFNDGFCSYRYLNSITIKKLPLQKNTLWWDNPNVNTLDFPNQEYPDVQVRIKNNSEQHWETITEAYEDISSFPVSYQTEIVGGRYLLTESTYIIQILDKDINSYEVMYQDTIFPITDYDKDSRSITVVSDDNTSEVQLNYSIF